MTRKLPISREVIDDVHQPSPQSPLDHSVPADNIVAKCRSTSTLWTSEGHPVNRKTGKREFGGPFHVTHSGNFISPGRVSNITNANAFKPYSLVYSGPVFMPETNYAEALLNRYNPVIGSKDLSKLDPDGATAISQCAPTNPTANLGTGLAESFREGVPSLPGIQSWQRRVGILKNLGSEYLNYQFGWEPLRKEVSDVVNASRHHRDILQNYRHNEGRNVHRRFDFPDEKVEVSEELGAGNPLSGVVSTDFCSSTLPASSRRAVYSYTRKRWFEGCFTYGGPSGTDSFRRAIGFGSNADALYGLTLTPTLLWELVPWSWAVDWFTNAGDVINNVTQFAAAGLVMRYGYMMEETITELYTEWSDAPFYVGSSKKDVKVIRQGSGRRGKFAITRSRAPANPFGFGVGWEGLSPTQLAITAAIGITRLL